MIDRKTYQQHDWYGVACQAFGEALWSLLACHMTQGKGVVAYYGIADQSDIGLCGTDLLILPGEALKESVEFLPTVIKAFKRMP